MTQPTPHASHAAPGSLQPLTLDAHDLAQRLALASSSDTCKGMFFNGLFVAVQRKGGEAVDRLKQARSQKFVDFFNYPIAEFLPLAFLAAELVAQGATPAKLAEGIRSLGRQATDDFLGTAVGKTLLMLSGSDPRRLMNSLSSGYKTAVSYGVRSVTWTGASSCVFSMRRDFMPHPYHEGVLEQVVSAVGGRDAKVTGRRLDVLDTDYEVSWR
ncbi:MAG: DUF2378 family protein [Myxococcaceae bacterium]|nr:DUF2378 family protein [Myxococcaceae bacterium]